MVLTLLADTSGYSYKGWKGPFYPADLPASQMLSFYAERFPAVEINNTFYRMPNVASLQKWQQQVPDNFVFTLKAPQQITHIKRIKDVSQTVQHFYEVAAVLGKHRGPTLFQLPPFLKKDLPRLKEFLATLPADIAVAMEFRHPSRFDDGVYAALKAHNAALCLADVDEADACTPREITASWGYVRLRRSDYTPQKLHIWNAGMHAQSWTQAYVFLKHEDAGKGPAWAKELIAAATDALSHVHAVPLERLARGWRLRSPGLNRRAPDQGHRRPGTGRARRSAEHYAGAMIVDRCSGHFSSDKNEEALTLLVPDASGRYRRIVRLIRPEGGDLDELSWTAAEDFNTIDVPLPAPADARKLFFGPMRCVRPAELKSFLAQFEAGFTRSTAAHLDLEHRDSVCFRFDATYNAWQCFGYVPGQRRAVRWGYQALVD